MQDDRPSETALSAAALRTAHLIHDSDPIFEDTLAGELTSAEWRERLAAGEVGPMIEHLGLRPVQGQLLGRMRFLEDAIERAVEAGIDQYVLLGAGLDSFAWRRADLLERLRVVELDHPATQGYKRRRLQELGLDLPEGVSLVCVDFERTTIEGALAATDHDPGRPSFFSWMGVVGYLTLDAFEGGLAGIARVAAPGSELLFDYPIHPDLVDESDRALTRVVDRGTADLGEQRKLKQYPEQVRTRALAHGLERLEDVAPDALRARYFAGREDGLEPNPEVHLTRLRRAAQ